MILLRSAAALILGLTCFSPAAELPTAVAGKPLARDCPRIAFIRRKSCGLRGTNGTMFSQRTDVGSAILTALIESGHGKVDMDDEGRRRVYAWIDSNIQYYHTWDMSRPHTCGGRDTWNFVKDNARVRPESEPWLVKFKAAWMKRCVSCHG